MEIQVVCFFHCAWTSNHPASHPNATPSHFGRLGKRKRKHSSEDDSKRRHRDFCLLEDKVLWDPVRKRHVSSQLVRKSFGTQYKANLGACGRNSHRTLEAHCAHSRLEGSCRRWSIGTAFSKMPEEDHTLNTESDPSKDFVTSLLAAGASKKWRQGSMTSFGAANGPMNLKTIVHSVAMSNDTRNTKSLHGSSLWRAVKQTTTQQLVSQARQRPDQSVLETVRRGIARKTRL